MSGMEPMLIGAALGGGVSAARGGNPLKGALLGAVGGGLGGAVLGAGNAAATAGMTGASAVPVGASGLTTLPATGATGVFAAPTMPTFAATGGSTGLIPSITAPATLMDQIGAATKFAKENPFQMNLASNVMQQNAQEDAQRLAEMRARSGLMTGKQIPVQQQRSSFGVPQLSLI